MSTVNKPYMEKEKLKMIEEKSEYKKKCGPMWDNLSTWDERRRMHPVL
jgi:hypothetical protein